MGLNFEVEMTELYIGTKLINAEPMTRAEYNVFRGWELPADENGDDEGYLVEYLDGDKPNTATHAGYVSWSPKEQFDNAYRKTSGMSFGLAVEAMKKGNKVARAGWNGKGMFTYYVPAGNYPVRMEQIKGIFTEDMVPYRYYLALKTAQGDVATWAPPCSDALADDWYIVD